MLADRKLTTIVFFLDETFEELSYDMCTTAQEATEQLAATIKLENHSTFALFDCRRVRCSACQTSITTLGLPAFNMLP